jgi:hypothetical protein
MFRFALEATSAFEPLSPLAHKRRLLRRRPFCYTCCNFTPCFFESPQQLCSAASTPTSSTLSWIRAAQSRKKYIFRTEGLLHGAADL